MRIGVCVLMAGLTVSCAKKPSAGSGIRDEGEVAQGDVGESELLGQIRTAVDPAFVYEYSQTRFVPPQGKTLLIMGQTVQRIEEHVEAFPDRPLPGGWSAYWPINKFEGIKKPHTNQTGGTQHHQWLINKFPDTVLHSAIWMVGTWDVANNTINGEYDDVVERYAAWARNIDRPLYLRIGYEFDGPHNELDPVQYVAAYRHVADLLRSEGLDNVALVWHSYASTPFQDHPVEAWYPGDDYVDWVAISTFDQAYSGGFGVYGDAVLEFAKAHGKPVMIAEANPVRGITTDGVEAWEDWFVNFFSLVHEKNIKAVAFINEDWRSFGPNGLLDWQDGRLVNNPTIAEAWFEETSRERYLKQSPDLFATLGYELPE
ncbi:MAG: glycosyl hydrolase [Myxococcota bacterium]